MVTYSVDRNGTDRRNRGSLKIPVDKKEKGRPAGGFYLIFCLRSASTLRLPFGTATKSLLFRPQDATTLKIAFG